MVNRLVGPVATAAMLIAAVTACAPGPSAQPTTTPSSTSSPTASASPPATSDAEPSTPAAAPDEVVGTVVRFTSDRTAVDVTVGEDSPAVRDFLSMLPLEVPFEEFSGREKIAYLPRALQCDGSYGSDPEDGDLIYYTPWGNLGFYYDASGVGYSDDTLHLGTYDATEEQLSLLEGEVTIEVID